METRSASAFADYWEKVEHEIHHRGQLYLLLAMCGVPTPPLYGLTEEQVRAASGSSAEGS
jgi:DinB family